MTMILNLYQNRHFGLGGGTRCLHHKKVSYGGKIASTDVIKGKAVLSDDSVF